MKVFAAVSNQNKEILEKWRDFKQVDATFFAVSRCLRCMTAWYSMRRREKWRKQGCSDQGLDGKAAFIYNNPPVKASRTVRVLEIMTAWQIRTWEK